MLLFKQSILEENLFFCRDEDEKEIEAYAFENKAVDLEANEETKQTTL